MRIGTFWRDAAAVVRSLRCRGRVGAGFKPARARTMMSADASTAMSGRCKLLVWCPTNTDTNLRVLLAVGCVRHSGLDPGSSSRGARHQGGDRRSPLQVIAPCRQPKCPRIFITVFVRHHTSVVSRKFLQQFACLFCRRRRCSSSRGARHTGGFETRPYKSSRLADNKKSRATYRRNLRHTTLAGCVKTPTSGHERPLRHSRESGNPGVLEGSLRGVSPLHPAWIPAFAGMTFSGAVASLEWGFDTAC